MTPKIIHQIWLGSKAPPYSCMRTWMHSGWEYHLWREIDLWPLINQTQYDWVRSYTVKSDIWRYEILYRFGGLYVDVDFALKSPLPELPDLFAVKDHYWYARRGYLANGFMGGQARHPYFHALIQRIKSLHIPNPNLHGAMTTGPKFITECAEGFEMSALDDTLYMASPTSTQPAYVVYYGESAE